jgi:crotonobetainyl-CoA:carnitine CoA-transferase CaiB-like acyl-CoA transferase
MQRPLPLAGLRVVEFSHMVMGPTAGMIMADLGADVIKVEPVGDGDKTRRLGGSGAGYFPAYNRNKRSLAVDLKSPDGRALARRLALSADIVTENFSQGALERLGLGAAALRAENPQLIYCSMKGFLTGPYQDRTALDEVVQMMGGLAYMTGPPGQPLRAGASVNDVMGGMFAVIGILAALHERDRSGQGQTVRSGLYENNAFLVAQHMAQAVVTGKPAAPMPVRVSAWAIYDVFATGDGSQIFVAVVSDTQWAKFCEAFALGDLLADESLSTNTQRVAARDRLIPRLRALFLERPRSEIDAACEAAGLPFAPLKRPDELFDDPHLNHPGAMLTLTLPGGAPLPLPALPLEFEGDRLGLRRDLPEPGEHSLAVIEELGLSLEEIDRLVAQGTISFPD